MSKTYDVIVAGAGPVGLFLAGELALGGASVLVLERDAARGVESPFKVAPLGFRGVNTLTLECLSRRGLLDTVFPADKANLKGMMKSRGGPGGNGPGGKDGPPASTRLFKKTEGMQFGGHFAGMFFDANKLDLGRWKYRVNGPGMVPGPATMATVEAVYGERATRLGVNILYGHTLTAIVEGSEEGSKCVKVEATDAPDDSTKTTKTLCGRWLVGCDGGQSIIRRTAGFHVEGSDPKLTGYAMRCDITNGDKLTPGFTVTDGGLYIAGAFGDTVYLMDPDGGAFDRSQELTMEHLQTVLTRVTRVPEVKITALRVATSFTDRCRHATHYRRGRVLLAGDAAHTHATFGAQGMNLGMGDAMNLGWKLASVVRQEAAAASTSAATNTADTALLDTYDAERLPVAAQVLEMSRAQSMAFLPDVFGRSVRSLLQQTLDTVDGANLFMGLFWGLSQKYDLVPATDPAQKHPLVGLSAPDFVLDGKDENSADSVHSPRLNHHLATGHGLLVDVAEGGNASLRDLVAPASEYAGRVDYLAAPDVAAKRGLQAFLVRPDGIVAWAVDDGADINADAVKAELARWFAF
ncbi:hypothetical protein SPBR_05795 [Sporothrix brasiliensis 5110]|uniref:FAD-binding domain-containing protein n=1 Tax=Sporothrix brasiliensis 5110 TaxID=1398154 RepID=A0A0C2IXU9_9PEZI|nr:uncharacterized protein SPBR_05795 [Sporothrix brasiliensis 5110]KIH93951.1 hypothetical protein SPBR_05795 [Sporothrix brasiliensis 5110]